jgi:hypothetical protein
MLKAIKIAAAACCISLIAIEAHAAGEPPALAPFYQFVGAMNAGDTAKAAALFTPASSIIDEFGPHIWKSFADWNRDLAAFFKAGGVSDFHIAIATESFKDVGATHGYGVAPTTLTYKVKGKPTTEKGLFTFSTAKTADGWRITGWAWSTL